MICGVDAPSSASPRPRHDCTFLGRRWRALPGWIAALALGLLIAAPAVGRAGEVRSGLTIPSPTLGRDIRYALYLPAGYVTSHERYPVLFLLHGHGGGELDWVHGGGLAATLDRLITAGAVPPMLVVMPGLGNGWDVDNLDPGGSGRTETAFLADIVPAIDRQWRTRGERSARAVAGLSMGGFGALRFAMLRPDLFAAAASLSGALLTNERAADRDWAPWLAEAFGAPVDLARYRRASPFGLVDALAAAEHQPALYLACGDDDELGLEEGNLEFYLALRRVGVRAELRITDGGHDWGLWSRQLEPMLRFVGGELAGVATAAPP